MKRKLKRTKWLTISRVLGATALGLLVFLLTQSSVVLENIETAPARAKKLMNQLQNWYYDDSSWSGIWSTKAEGYIDYFELSEVDFRIEISAEQGVIGGIVSAPEICQALPLFDFVMLEGNISGHDLKAVAFDFINGKRVELFSFRMSLNKENNTATVYPTQKPNKIFERVAKVRKHPQDSISPPNGARDYCASERETFLQSFKNRPEGNTKRVPLGPI